MQTSSTTPDANDKCRSLKSGSEHLCMYTLNVTKAASQQLTSFFLGLVTDHPCVVGQALCDFYMSPRHSGLGSLLDWTPLMGYPLPQGDSPQRPAPSADQFPTSRQWPLPPSHCLGQTGGRWAPRFQYQSRSLPQQR